MRIVETDLLIIGSGASGLTASVYAALEGIEVLVIDKGVVGRSGSTVGAVQLAGSGRWSSQNDTKESYYKDVLISGKGLSNPSLVNVLVQDIEKVIDDLVEWGLKLDMDDRKKLMVTTASGHDHPRSISAKKGNSGLAILQTLLRKANKLPNIKRESDMLTINLLTFENKVQGAIVYDLAKAELLFILSKSVILATGGTGQLYPVTSNPVQATGDGFSLALKAGADLIDMEQIQFYPVSLLYPESLKGFCMSFYHLAKLMNNSNERFMQRYEPEKLEDVTRDRLAYAVACEVRAGRGTAQKGILLDGTSVIEEIKKLFPHEYKLCLQQGLDLEKEYAEITPAAHFIMGGVEVNEDGASSVTGLYAIGETAGGLHGGNRLGNNALSECLVFGARAGKAAAQQIKESSSSSAMTYVQILEVEGKCIKSMFPTSGTIRPYQIKDRLRRIMGEYIGVLRNMEDLHTAQNELQNLFREYSQVTVNGFGKTFSREVTDYIEAGHMLWTAKGIIGSAISRNESRGAHILTDIPEIFTVAEHTTVKYEKGQLKFKKKLVENKKVGDLC